MDSWIIWLVERPVKRHATLGALLATGGAIPRAWPIATFILARCSKAARGSDALQGCGKLPQLVVNSDAPTVSRHLGTADLSWRAESCHGWWA